MQTYIRYTENLTLTSFERKWQNKISVKKKDFAELFGHALMLSSVIYVLVF